MTDPIKAALEAAEQGFYTPFIASLHDQVLAGKPPMRVTQETHRQCLAAAIAAFLTHYAAHHAAQGIMAPDLDEIAAAVEAAAREGGRP